MDPPLRPPKEPRTFPSTPRPPYPAPTEQDANTYVALREIFVRHHWDPNEWMLPPMRATAETYTLTDYDQQLRDLSERQTWLSEGRDDLLTPQPEDLALLEDLAHLSDFHRLQYNVARWATGPHSTKGYAAYACITWIHEVDEGAFPAAGVVYNLDSELSVPSSSSRYFSGFRLNAALQTYFLYFQPLPRPPPRLYYTQPAWIPLFKTFFVDEYGVVGKFPAYLPWSVFALTWMNRPRAAGDVVPIGPRLNETYPALAQRFPGLQIGRAEWPSYYPPLPIPRTQGCFPWTAREL